MTGSYCRVQRLYHKSDIKVLYVPGQDKSMRLHGFWINLLENFLYGKNTISMIPVNRSVREREIE